MALDRFADPPRTKELVRVRIRILPPLFWIRYKRAIIYLGRLRVAFIEVLLWLFVFEYRY